MWRRPFPRNPPVRRRAAARLASSPVPPPARGGPASGSGLAPPGANNNNGGWGSVWAASGGGGTFRSSSTGDNVGDPGCTSFTSAFDINSLSGNALGMYGGGSGDEVITRTFAALAAGQVVSIDFRSEEHTSELQSPR